MAKKILVTGGAGYIGSHTVHYLLKHGYSPSDINLHHELSEHERSPLPGIPSKQTERTVQNDFTFSLKSQWYQITREQRLAVCKKDKVIVEERPDGTIFIRLRGKYLNYKIIPQRPEREIKPETVLTALTQRENSSPKKPAPNHLWRQYQLTISQAKSGHFNFPPSRTF